MDMNTMTFRHSKSTEGVCVLTVDEIPHLVVTGRTPIECVKVMNQRLRDMAKVLNLKFIPETNNRPPIKKGVTKNVVLK